MKIAIIDDERLIREGLKVIFSTYPDIEIAALGCDGNEAFEICQKYNPDLILMDIRMPNCNGIEAIKKIHKHYPEVKILILTTFTDIDYIQEAIKQGGSGYLLKDSSPDVIYDGIKAALSGNIVINPEVAQEILLNQVKNNGSKNCDVNAIMEEYDLSKKEIDIIKLVAEGFSNKEIARKQSLSEGTIKNNISAIFLKTFVSDRTGLTAFAFKNDLM